MNNPIKLWRVPKMVFGPRELESGLAAMTPDVLAKIRTAGFTGVWAMVRLRDVVRPMIFHGLKSDHTKPQAMLAELNERCQRAGLKL